MAGDLTPITTAQTAWNTAFTTHVTAQQTAKSATQQKNADRAAVVSLVRALVGQLQASAEVDDTERAALGCGTGVSPVSSPPLAAVPQTGPPVLTGETPVPQRS